jgi:hypothetical protein
VLTPAEVSEIAAELIRVRVQEVSRLDRIREALRTPAPGEPYKVTVQIPADAPLLMRDLALKSITNYLPLLVKTFGQVLKVDGYYSESDPDAVEPWHWWQRNRMDSRQTGVIRSVLSYGAAYAVVLPGVDSSGVPGPSISLFSPRNMTAFYEDPESDEWPKYSIQVKNGFASLYDEEFIYPVDSKVYSDLYGYKRTALLGEPLSDPMAHDLGVCPVVRIRDRNLLAGEERYGIVEPLMIVQDRIDETTFQMMVAQYFGAFRQRYVLGWVPKNDSEKLKSGAARSWYFPQDPTEIKVGNLEETDVRSYIDTRNSAIRDLAAIGQIPAQALGIDGISNISDATLAGLEAAKSRETGEISTSIGESFEQMLRLSAYVDGNESAANDYSSEIRWRNFESRSFAQTVDGLTKLVAGLGLDPMLALEEVPGITPQKLERAKAAASEARASNDLDALLAALPATPLGSQADAGA